MSKHTSGPWRIAMSDNGTPIINHEHGHDKTDPGDLSSRVCAMPAEIAQHFNSLENARLIAAAPDLLEVLARYVQQEHAHGCTDNNLFRSAQDAISKATGGQQ